jgi:sigma 54 modulation/S30EA-like ribosomal protein
MTPYIEVSFSGLEPDPSVESAIHRWIARLEAMPIEIQRARVRLEPSGRRRIMVSVTLTLMDGIARAAATIQADVYVGVADAFRAVRQQMLPPVPQTRARVVALA